MTFISALKSPPVLLLGFLKENPMGKNPCHLPFKSLFSNLKSSIPKASPSPSPWPCPSSDKPISTLSFQLFDETVVSVSRSSGLASTASSSATTSPPLEPGSSSTAASADFYVKVAMQAVRSRRLLFDRGGSSNRSLMSNVNAVEVRVPFEGSVAVEMESKDPYRDFRASMEEMVRAEGGIGKKGWVWFEEMLVSYLRLNKRWAHEFIVGAYCDVLMEMMTVASSSCSSVGDRSCSCCSSKSSSYASCVSAIEEVKEGEEEGKP